LIPIAHYSTNYIEVAKKHQPEALTIKNSIDLNIIKFE